MAPQCAHYYHAMTQYFIEYHNLYRIVLIRPHLGAESRSSPEKYGLVGCKAKCGIHCWERWKNAIVFSNCCHGFFYSHPSPLKLPCQLSGEKHIGQLWLLVSSKRWVAGFLPVQIIPLHLGLESTCLLLFLELHLLLASVWHHNFIILIYLAFGLSFNPNLGLCIRGYWPLLGESKNSGTVLQWCIIQSPTMESSLPTSGSHNPPQYVQLRTQLQPSPREIPAHLPLSSTGARAAWSGGSGQNGWHRSKR